MQSKRQPGPPTQPMPADLRMSFAEHPPSQAWERLGLPDVPQSYLWAWFKPATAPQGLILRVPDELYRPEFAAQLTMRKLLHAAAIPPASVAAWLVNGVSIPGMNGANPYFDAPLPPPVPGMSPDIMVYLLAGPVVVGPLAAGPVGAMPPFVNGAPVVSGAPMVPVMPVGPLAPQMAMGAMPGAPMMPGMVHVPATMPGQPMFNVQPVGGLSVGASITPMDATQPLDAATVDIYERIEADWNSSNEVEKDLTRLRKQLVDILGRLKTLNRDLNGPERVHSNNQDKKDWQDARRCLRDATNRVWKYLKAHDIGDTSNAGKRVAFEETYRKYIAPRRPFKEFMATARAFESHRKTITTLHGDMSNAYSYASLDGERRAQQVLNRIQTKVREASNKKNFLGVVLDS
jgi:hypothetical protein